MANRKSETFEFIIPITYDNAGRFEFFADLTVTAIAYFRGEELRCVDIDSVLWEGKEMQPFIQNFCEEMWAEIQVGARNYVFDILIEQ